MATQNSKELLFLVLPLWFSKEVKSRNERYIVVVATRKFCIANQFSSLPTSIFQFFSLHIYILRYLFSYSYLYFFGVYVYVNINNKYIHIYLLRRWLQEHVATPGTSTSPNPTLVPKNHFRVDQVLGFGCQSLRQYTDNDLRNFEIWCWGPDSANLGSSGSLEAALRAYDAEFFSTVEGEMCCSAHDSFFCNTLFVAFVGCWFLDRRNEFKEILRMLVVAIPNLGIHGGALPELQVWLAGTSIRALPLTW